MAPRIIWMLLLILAGCPRPLPRPVERRPPPLPPPQVRIPLGCEQPLTGDWQHLDEPSFRYRVEDHGKEVTVWVYRVFLPTEVDAGRPTKLFPRGTLGTSGDAGTSGPRRAPDAGFPEAGVKRSRPAGGPDGGALDAGGVRWADAADAGAPDAAVTSSAAALRDAGAPDSGVLAGGGQDHHHPLPAELLRRDGGPAPLATAVIHLRRTAEGFIGAAEMLHLLPSGRECRATFATRVTACTRSTLTLSSATSTPVGEGCQTPSLPQPAAMLEHRLARTDAGAL